MKKTISVFLTVLMIGLLLVPAFALQPSRDGSQIPMIDITGDGVSLVDANDNEIVDFRHVLNAVKDSNDSGGIRDALKGVLQKFLVNGLIAGDFEPYYESLQQEVGDLFKDIRPDENGNVTDGSGIAPWARGDMDWSMHYDRKGDKGFYAIGDYHFWYDWRLDPLETADKLDEFIQAIKSVTGAPKVAISGRCVGSNVLLAYLAKYGYQDVCGIGVDGGVVGGAQALSDPISGKFRLDGSAIERMLIDVNAYGLGNIDEFIIDTVDLATKSGLLDRLSAFTHRTLYDKMVVGVTGALALSTLYACPNYWGGVTAEDYQDALYYVFGPEGSEKRQTYAGLIEKLDRYDALVRQRIPEILQGAADAGVNVCFIAKYGCQMVPVGQSGDLIADQIAAVKSASFGATTSTVYDTLSDDYIAAQTEKGLERYISPDKQIDASTCLFPDSTWFLKGARHSNWTEIEDAILVTVMTADRQLTVEDLDCTQFIVYHNDTGVVEPMTADNCHTEVWTADAETDHPTTLFGRIRSFLSSLVRWFKSLFAFLQARNSRPADDAA